MSTLASGLRESRVRLRSHLSVPLFRHGYTLLIGSASMSVLGLVYWLVAARIYPPEIVGIGSAAISMLMLVSGLAGLGLTGVIVRYLPTAGDLSTRLVLWSYGAAIAVSAAAGVGAALGIGHVVSDLDFLATSRWWLAAFALSTVLWTVFGLQDAVLTALRQTHWVTIENTAFAIAKIVLLVGLAALATTEAPLFASWVLPSAVAVLALSLLIFGRSLPEHRRKMRGRAAPISPARMLRFAGGNYGGSALMQAALYVMPLIVASQAGATATAYFYVPWAIFVGAQLVAMNMTTSLTVEAARDEELLADYCRKALFQTIRLLLPIAALLVITAPFLLRVFGANYEAEGTPLMRWLALATIPNAVVVAGISVARVRHQGWLVLAAQAAVACAGIGASYALLPVLGLEGAGIAWLVAQVAIAVPFLVGPLRIPLHRRGLGDAARG